MKRSIQLIAVLLFSLFIVACSQDSNEENNVDQAPNGTENVNGDNEDNEELEDVTVTISTASDGDWLEEMKPIVEEKFPHITLELVDNIPYVDEEEFEEVVFQGDVPDIIPVREHRRDFMNAREYELEYDFEEIVEKKNFDLTVFDDSVIESLRNATPTGGIVALPFQSNYFALHYNKDIFDQLGVDYPEEQMTWYEVMDLAADMTREGYKGITFNQWLAWFMFTQFEENLIDPDTLEVHAENSTALREMFTMLEMYASIPENRPAGEWGGTFEDGDVAMEVNWARTYDIEEGIGVDFDFAPFPTWDANPGVSVEPNIAAWMITSSSENKEAAFDVLTYLTSAEARL